MQSEKISVIKSRNFWFEELMKEFDFVQADIKLFVAIENFEEKTNERTHFFNYYLKPTFNNQSDHKF